MAIRFGTKIVPFGVVREDDIGEVSTFVLDYDDFIKIPLRNITEQYAKLRGNSTVEVAHQELHLPCIMPRIPGRLYLLFGKAIETGGMKKELQDREKTQKLYLEVKSEVEKCIDYLKQKREKDPYRNILSRMMYRTVHGPESEEPTFEL